MLGRSGKDGAEYALQGAAELHGFGEGLTVGGVVDVAVGIIHNDTGTPFSLGDASNG